MRLLLDIISVLGVLLTALGTYLTIRSGVSPEVISNELVVGCLILSFIAIFFFFHYFARTKILESVLRGHRNLDNAMSQIAVLNKTPDDKIHIEKGITSLSEICQGLSGGLRNYHAPDISVCIHYVNEDSNGYYVNVLCRNTESKHRQSKRPPAHSTKDYIDENSDFKTIIPMLRFKQVDEIYYMNNFIPFSIFYRNSHFSQEMKDKYYGFGGWYYRISKWELPYKSAMVVPLLTIDEKNNRSIEGFLSIDSPKLWSFSKKYDLPIVLKFANAIAPVIAKYNRSNLLNKTAKNEK